MKMLKKEAQVIVGGLSNTSKMPCLSFGISAEKCITGSKLAKIPGSVCSGCYALSGMYKWKSTQGAHNRRQKALKDPSWPAAMITLITGQEYFRWLDSGDIQGMWMLKNIVLVCNATPDTMHWLPSKESRIVKRFLNDGGIIPDNLIIRISAPMIDKAPPIVPLDVFTSTVHMDKPAHGKKCKAPFQNGECKNCRMCWDKDIENISYEYHGKKQETIRKESYSVSMRDLLATSANWNDVPLQGEALDDYLAARFNV